MAFITNRKIFQMLMQDYDGKKIVAEAPKLDEKELEKKIKDFANSKGIELPTDEKEIVSDEKPENENYDEEADIEELMNDIGAKRWKKGADYKGYDVYIPVYSKTRYIGEPTVVLVNDDEIRYSTYDESFEYLRFIQKASKNYNEDDDD